MTPGRVAIVGAGPAGLAALRALDARGIDATAFERGRRVGGVWTLEDRPTAAYRSLHLITSRPRTQFAEHPMPDGTPDYPARDEVGRWLESYVTRFELVDRIRLQAEVVRAERATTGWTLELRDGRRESFDVLVVASGHNEVPAWPDPPYPGSDAFAGRQLHALDFGEGRDFEGRRVLVVGMGNSAMDIATDLSHFAARTVLSVRRGSWVIPKRMLGRPADQVMKPWVAARVPWRLRQALAQTLLTVTAGRPQDVGLPAPDGGLFQSHPTISDTIISRIAHGRIVPRPGIVALDERGARFTDGTREDVDAIVWCTGYRVEIPYLDLPHPQELRLYKHVLHPDEPSLAFIGLMQSTGSAFPILERQSELLAEHLAGRWRPPGPQEMRRDAEKRIARARRRWGDHGRPAMRVDFDAYMHELARELERGRTRA